MKCPHCEQEIDDALLAKHLAAKGGRSGKREITPEQQRKMQEARKKEKEGGNYGEHRNYDDEGYGVGKGQG